jgi:transcriptional regulator with XRE-family HTH domain
MKRSDTGYITSGKNLGDTLRRLRLERGNDLREVAEEVGLSHSQLSYVERNLPNARLTPESLVRLCVLYRVRLKLEAEE